jgi:hypothetical protein
VNLKGGDHLEDLGVNVTVILNLILKVECEGMARIYCAQDKILWQDFVHTVMNFNVTQKREFLVTQVTCLHEVSKEESDEN